MFVSLAKAADDVNTIVTCNGLDCNICSLFKVVTNLFDWLLFVSAAAAIFFVAIGGLIYIGARGREDWMSQAKRTVIWAISGFAFVLLAHLSIRVSFKIMGATNQGMFDKFECDAGGGSSSLPKVPSKSTTDLANEVEQNGSTGGALADGTTEGELKQVFDKISDESMLIYALENNNQRKPIIALTKKSHWFDWDLIKTASTQKTAYLFTKEALAADSTSSNSNSSAGSEEDYRKIAFQVVAGLIKNKQKVVTIVTSITEGSLLSGISVNDLYSVIDSFGTCAGSEGTWYRYSDLCSFEKGSCKETNCVSSSGGAFINGCKCPTGKCRQGNECVGK